MKLTSLRVCNLLSFDNFEVPIESGLTVMVGPNGAGKTNVLRVLDLISKLVEWSDEQTSQASAAGTVAALTIASYSQAAHDKVPPGAPREISVGVEWTTPRERQRIVAFVRAALAGTLLDEAHVGDEESKAKLSEWVIRGVDDRQVSPLYKGILAFRHPGYPTGLWQARYRFEQGDRSFDWVLYDASSWDSSISPRGLTVENATPRARAWQVLFGEDPNTTPSPPLPAPLPVFELKALCPSDERVLGSLVVRQGTGTFNDLHEVFRAAAEALEIPIDQGGRQAYGLARAFSLCLREGLVVLGETFRGLGVGGAALWPPGMYPWEPLGDSALPRDPALLPLRLFHLKNSASSYDRDLFVAVQRQFDLLAPGRSFDLTFTPSKTRVPVGGPVGAGQVAVPASDDGEKPGSFISVVVWEAAAAGQPRRERPIQLFGAGTWEALVLAETLVASAGRVTVLDEPALNLHPTWQTELRRAIEAAPGQFVLVTHSPDLVPCDTAEALGRIIRVTREGGASQSYRLPTNPTPLETARVARALLSANARSLLFCSGAVIVSGETELGALPVWFSKSKCAEEVGSPSRHDIAFFSVSGDGGFASVLYVLGGFCVPWALVCDGKSFDIETCWRSHIFRQIQSAGIEIPELTQFTGKIAREGKAKRIMTNELWAEQLSLGARNGVLTLATDWKTGANEAFEGFMATVIPSDLLARAAKEVGLESKVRRGTWLAQQSQCPDEVDKLYRDILAAFSDERDAGHE